MDGHPQFAARLQSTSQPVGNDQPQDVPCRRGEQCTWYLTDLDMGSISAYKASLALQAPVISGVLYMVGGMLADDSAGLMH